MNTFDNTTEPAAQLRALRDRAERFENLLADMAAELQETRLALIAAHGGDISKATNYLTKKGLIQ